MQCASIASALKVAIHMRAVQFILLLRSIEFLRKEKSYAINKDALMPCERIDSLRAGGSQRLQFFKK